MHIYQKMQHEFGLLWSTFSSKTNFSFISYTENISRCCINLDNFDQHFHTTQIFHTLKICHPFCNIYRISAFCLSSKTKLISKITFASIIHFSWSSGNAFISGAGGLRFKSRTGQIGHSVANGSPPLRHFFEWSCVAGAQWRGDGPRQLVTRSGALQRV